MKSRPIIVDTNALVYLVEKKAFNQLRLLGPDMSEAVVTRSVLTELEGLTRSVSGKNKFGLSLSLAKTLRIHESSGEGDDAIIISAKELDSCVLTNDKALKTRLRTVGIPVYSVSRSGRIVKSR